MITNTLIIGGGISGLYCAYLLTTKYLKKNIIIIEKSNNLGGRIYTYKKNNIQLELGAGGIMDSHILMNQLIKDLNLTLSEGSSGKSHLVLKTDINNLNKYQNINLISIENSDFYDIIDNLLNKLNDVNFLKLSHQYSLYTLIEKYYGYEKANMLMHQFGYHNDFLIQNSYQALMMFKNDFPRNYKFHRIIESMSQIIENLKNKLINLGVKIIIDCELFNLKKKNNKFINLTSKGIIVSNNTIFAIPKNNILKINYFYSLKNLFELVINKPLIRIYMITPPKNNNVWFHDINTIITTDTIINQLIPIDKNKGIIMIYCDGNHANILYNFYKNNILKEELLYFLKKIFPNKIFPDLSDINFIVNYNESATHIWKIGIDPEIESNKIIKPIENDNIFIVGECYSTNQQWCEGALKSVHQMLNLYQYYF